MCTDVFVLQEQVGVGGCAEAGERLPVGVMLQQAACSTEHAEGQRTHVRRAARTHAAHSPAARSPAASTAARGHCRRTVLRAQSPASTNALQRDYLPTDQEVTAYFLRVYL